MFESAELGHSITKRAYDKDLPRLRTQLLAAQVGVLDKGEFPLILLLGGVGGSGRGDVVNTLLQWMDPRHIRIGAGGDPTDRERDRPTMWRYWNALPPKGKMGVFFGGWYSAPIADRVGGRSTRAVLTRQLFEIARFERMLVDEGAVIVKLWLHLTKKGQRRRFEQLESSPATAWRVKKEDWKNNDRYDAFRDVGEHALRETSTAEAPWTVIEATDERFRNLTVGRTLLDAMRARLDRGKRAFAVLAAPPPPPPIDARNILRSLDLSKKLAPAVYSKKLPELQGRVNALSRDKSLRDRAVVLVFEGNDAAGKGGAIRRVTQCLDARRYEVVPIAAPTEEERAQPYLWRFWRHVPGKGQFVIFDRSWYGRVLVERVEKLAQEADWLRAYREIIDFEDALGHSGIIVVKFWLAITKEEQLARFRAREKTAFKKFKITPDDWRNRQRWDAYEQAVCDMVDRTGTDRTPWHLVEANDKHWARIRILQAIEAALARAISGG